MKNYRIWLLLLGMILFRSVFASSTDRTVFVQIEFGNNLDILQTQLLAVNADIARFDRRNHVVDVFLNERDLPVFVNMGFKVRKLHNDDHASIDRLGEDEYLSHFQSVEAIYAELDSLAMAYPEIMQLVDIGDSYNKMAGKNGFDILAVKISDNVFTDEKNEAEILYFGAIHAREIITPAIIMDYIRYLINNFQHDPYITHLINNREIWLIPCLNPDGYNYVLTGDYAGRNSVYLNPIRWRKNMQDNNGNGFFDNTHDGVDLNRNFGFTWGVDDVGSSSVESSDVYRGQAPFSEPETWSLKNFIDQHNFLISMSYHSYGRMVLYPWEHIAENPPEPDLTIFRTLGDSCSAYNGYNAGNYFTETIDYQVNGGSDDWMYGEKGIYALTTEVGSVEQGAFWPNLESVPFLLAENLGANLYLTRVAGEEPVITNKSFTAYTKPSFLYTITATIEQPLVLTKSVPLDTNQTMVIYSLDNKAHFDSLQMTIIPSIKLFVAKIPGENFTGTLYYYISAIDSVGRQGTWPLGAPMALDSLVIPDVTSNITNTAQNVSGFELEPNYPNPFNGDTNITFTLAGSEHVTITIYNSLGQQIKTILNTRLSEGRHTITWDGSDEQSLPVSSGIYICEITNGKDRLLNKMIYIK